MFLIQKLSETVIDRLRCIQVFIEVARTGSFSSAARHLGMSRASVTKHVARLEDLLGARLLNRTTKQVGLTEAGLTALDNGQLLLERYDAIETDVLASIRTPRGIVRIGTPPAFGAHHLVPLIAQFTAQHPDIQVMLSLDVGDANLVARGLDLSVRIVASMNDASYIAQHLAKAPQLMVASPDYLKAQGTPTRLADLVDHNCLVHLIKAPTSIWRFTGPDGPASIRVRGSIASDFGEALMHAALDGQGISVHPYYMVSQHLEEGRLVAVLPDFEPDAHDIFVIYSSRQRLPERVRRFLSFLRDWARTPPQWSTRRSALAAGASRNSPVLNSPQTKLRRPHVRWPLRSTEP